MKNQIKLLFVLFIALLMGVNACTKDNGTQSEQLPTHELGALLLPESEYAAIPIAPITDEMKMRALPTSINLVTPPVKNQGGEGSCVSWGVGYAGRSITWHQQYGGTYADNLNIFSPEFIYNQIKASADCNSGSYVTRGLDLIQSKGVCLWATMPYTDVNCSTMPNSDQLAEAANYKISSYARVNLTVNDIKTQLAAGKAVVVAGPVNKAYMYLGNNVVLNNFKRPSLGGHCYCVVGYDDAKNAFKFQNSWGTNWGSQGFGWINYNYITSWWQEAYVMNN